MTRLVGHDVAAARILVVAIVVDHKLPCLVPVRLAGTQVAQVPDHAMNARRRRRKRQPYIQQPLDVTFDKRLRFHGCQHLRAVDCLAVMAYRCRFARQLGRQLRVPRGEHGPAVDKDLRPDLLGHDTPIHLDRPALRRLGCRA